MEAFIFQDFEAKFDRTVFKRIQGKLPEAVFYNIAGEEVERVDIANMSREELNKMMREKGIPRKGHDEQ